jgi:hypothetical protein
VVRKQVKDGILPPEFLEIIEEQKKKTQRVWMRKFRKKRKYN